MDTNSYEWLQRCEAVSIIKRYIRTLWRDGEEAARHELQTTYDLYREVSEQRATRLRELVQQIWRAEKSALADEVSLALAKPCGEELPHGDPMPAAEGCGDRQHTASV